MGERKREIRERKRGREIDRLRESKRQKEKDDNKGRMINKKDETRGDRG